jgi:hypothetical protein
VGYFVDHFKYFYNNLAMLKSNEIANAFVKVMDSGDYEPAKQFLANECRYNVGETIYSGPDAIIETYKSHHAFAKAAFDSVLYKSELSQKSDNEFEVIYIDIITHGSKTHVYKCRQLFYLNPQKKIIKIIHEDIPGEYERIKAFYKEIGLQSS